MDALHEYLSNQDMRHFQSGLTESNITLTVDFGHHYVDQNWNELLIVAVRVDCQQCSSILSHLYSAIGWTIGMQEKLEQAGILITVQKITNLPNLFLIVFQGSLPKLELDGPIDPIRSHSQDGADMSRQKKAGKHTRGSGV